MKKLFIMITYLTCCCAIAYCDTVALKDGKMIKGIIVEDFEDRVVISTYEGEKTVLKADMSKMVYDLAEQNFVALGDSYLAQDAYQKAYFYYQKALEVNPDHKAARDKMNYVMGYVYRSSEKEKIRDVARRQELEDWPVPEGGETDYESRLEKLIGIVLVEEDSFSKIESVVKESPAYMSGLREDDILISVWGRYTRYIQKDEIVRIMLEKNIGEIKVGIERDILIRRWGPGRFGHKEIIGGDLDIKFDGLIVTDIESGGPGHKSGLEENDLIVAINGESTRYMPLKEVIKRIMDSWDKDLKFTIRRDLTIWRS
ncbi:MAG: PDZ domain-containing protein [Candidatus Omnitrophota bacterium]